MITTFEVAAYAFDGELLGTGTQKISELSQKWLGVCSEFLVSNPAAFSSSLGGPLDHITFRWTSHAGTALVTAHVNGLTHSSYAFATGIDMASEGEILTIFAKSLRETEIVKHVAIISPFSEIENLSARPIMFVVYWPVSDTSDQDNDLVRELTKHLAAAFFIQTNDSRSTIQ